MRSLRTQVKKKPHQKREGGAEETHEPKHQITSYINIIADTSLQSVCDLSPTYNALLSSLPRSTSRLSGINDAVNDPTEV